MTFAAVIFDARSVVPNHVKSFATHAQAKAYVESLDLCAMEAGWAHWHNCDVYGVLWDGEIEEPEAAVYDTARKLEGE